MKQFKAKEKILSQVPNIKNYMNITKIIMIFKGGQSRLTLIVSCLKLLMPESNTFTSQLKHSYYRSHSSIMTTRGRGGI